jgi:hypothetical protein
MASETETVIFTKSKKLDPTLQWAILFGLITLLLYCKGY